METTVKGGIRMAITPSREGREPGFENETNDCFVQAMKVATGVPYRDAHAYVAERFKRVSRRGTMGVQTRMLSIATAKDTVFGYRVFAKPVPTRTTLRRRRFQYVQALIYPMLGDSMHMFRTGRYVVCSSTHAWAVIDGMVYDNGRTSNRTRVTEIYELVASSKCEAEGR